MANPLILKRTMRKLTCLLVLLSVGCTRLSAQEKEQAFVCDYPVAKASALIAAGDADAAIRTILAPAMKQYEDFAAVEPRRLYCSRTGPETLFYLLSAATETTGQGAVVIDYNFALAFFLYSYALADKRDLAGAEAALKRALELSPMNSRFLSEQGYLLQRRKEWAASLETYDKAFQCVEAYSPEEEKVADQTKALRGKGYALVELKKLPEARRCYLQCIELDPADKKAKAELKYVEAQLHKRLTE